jgi:hypothetical protein
MIDAVSIKEGEEGGNTSMSTATYQQDFASQDFTSKEELHTGRMCEATRAVKDTLSKVGSESMEGIKRAVECTRRHQTLALLVLGLGAGLMVGWILYQRK